MRPWERERARQRPLPPAKLRQPTPAGRSDRRRRFGFGVILFAVLATAAGCSPEATDQASEAFSDPGRLSAGQREGGRHDGGQLEQSSAGQHREAVGGGQAQTIAATQAQTAAATKMKVYKSPYCGCCSLWVDHMREAGFVVETENTMELNAVKAEAGLPPQLQSCHTALVGDYVFEGHIPAEVIARFLSEAPDARGLAVPGMPVGSPGMEVGNRVDPYDIILFDAEGKTSVYESR